MGLFFTTKKEREYKQAIATLTDIVQQKSALYGKDNLFTQQLYSALRFIKAGVIDYNMVSLINKGYETNPHIFTVINEIAQPASSLPWHVYRLDSKGKAERVYDTPINKAIDEGPNETQSWSDFVMENLALYDITGDGFIYYPQTAGVKYATRLYNLPSQITEIIPGGTREPAKGYRIKTGFNYDAPEFEPSEVMHRKRFNPTLNFNTKPEDLLRGFSPLRNLARTIQRSNEGIDAMVALIMNGHPAGVLTDATDEHSQVMTPQEVKAMDNSIIQKFGGGKKQGKILVSPTKLQWISLGLNPVDLQLLDADKHDLKTICNVYGVAHALVGEGQDALFSQSGTGLLRAEARTWERARMPNLNSFKENLNKTWIANYNKATSDTLWIEPDTSGVEALQLAKFTLSERLLKERASGILSENEYREAMDMEVFNDKEADRKVIANNLRFVDEAAPGQININQ